MAWSMCCCTKRSGGRVAIAYVLLHDWQVRLQDGHVLDTECFHSDYIPLRNNNGASLYGDVLAVMAVSQHSLLGLCQGTWGFWGQSMQRSRVYATLEV